ncbi:MAG: hypothetical protein OXU45_02360 [Candidatus Melainabacteria bacterium]|nr:hypothetical protein [Candidatus Melainabacteria bacterium]
MPENRSQPVRLGQFVLGAHQLGSKAIDFKPKALRAKPNTGDWAITRTRRLASPSRHISLDAIDLYQDLHGSADLFRQSSINATEQALLAIEEQEVDGFAGLYQLIAKSRQQAEHQINSITQKRFEFIANVIQKLITKVKADFSQQKKSTLIDFNPDSFFRQVKSQINHSAPEDQPYLHKAIQRLQSFVVNNFSKAKNDTRGFKSKNFLRTLEEAIDIDRALYYSGSQDFGKARTSSCGETRTLHSAYLSFDKVNNYLAGAKERSNYGFAELDGQIYVVPLTTATSTKFIHTDPEQFAICFRQLENLMTRLEELPEDSFKAKLETVGSIYWWAANMMYFKRGNAAITNTLIEVLMRRHDIDSKAFNSDSSADIEAFMSSEHEFVENFIAGKYGRIDYLSMACA